MSSLEAAIETHGQTLKVVMDHLTHVEKMLGQGIVFSGSSKGKELTKALQSALNEVVDCLDSLRELLEGSGRALDELLQKMEEQNNENIENISPII
ncbi:unnamed protein product [Caenorhabditis sp. 36 PRJEB53466]|nr:unnamed protein product [Caenorhabditis sp. 36 PRJEB53466]